MLNNVTSDFKIKIGQIFNDKKRDLIIVDREYRKGKYGVISKCYKYKCCGHYRNGEYKEELLIREML